MATTEAIIEARGLRKEFPGRGRGKPPVLAVEDLTVDIEAGSLTAFLGPNGAGKSTSLRMLTTLLAPSAGSATVCGYDIVTEPAAVRARIGYIGQKNGASQYQRVRDELMSQAAIYGLRRVEARQRVDEAIDALELGEVAGQQTMKLSGGQRRRVDIALGLIPAPGLLFLDEPSTGLDPQSRANLWEHILNLRQRYGMTLILTTHYLDEADQFAERVLVIDHGKVIADNTARALKTELAGDRLTVTVEDDSDSTADVRAGAAAIISRIAAEAGATDDSGTGTPTADGVRYVIAVDQGDRVLPRLLRELDAAGHTVIAAELDRPTLDDVFLNLTGRSLREDNRGADDPASTNGPASTPVTESQMAGAQR
ncbi:ABC transporter ATP-binding protein [Microlunatus soli]|uniref:ABC-2 type transport system ATP-binding protein n=1 Tax=Microlunatus soli TaxID=630515 RepID=A0A1H1V9H7_9ACTN|nr:ATP-binding cassette domain-containing protein [Microlunatus soli]SDS81365.1 ABC-2 type transport system ATP-binding protein [Microlunatus soli]